MHYYSLTLGLSYFIVTSLVASLKVKIIQTNHIFINVFINKERAENKTKLEDAFLLQIIKTQK